jgi:hypothetical protein
MTMPYGSTEEPDIEKIGMQSVPIHVVSSSLKPGKPIGAEFGQTRTIIVANAVGPNSVTPGAQRVLNRSLRRYEARISVLPTIVAQTVTDGAIFGAPGLIQSGAAAVIGSLGGFLPIGKDLVWKSQAELWVCYPASNAASVLVTVHDFQWASDPEAFKEEGIG